MRATGTSTPPTPPGYSRTGFPVSCVIGVTVPPAAGPADHRSSSAFSAAASVLTNANDEPSWSEVTICPTTPGRYVNEPVFTSKSYIFGSVPGEAASAGFVKSSSLSKNACEPSGEAYTNEVFLRPALRDCVEPVKPSAPSGAGAGSPSTGGRSVSRDTSTVFSPFSRTYSSGGSTVQLFSPPL